MIVLLSYNGDAATAEIMDWLQHLGGPYRRINLEDEDFRNITIEMTRSGGVHTTLLLQDGSILNVAEVSCFLFRGGLFSFDQLPAPAGPVPPAVAEAHQRLEFQTITTFFYEQVAAKCLGSPLLHPLNKLKQLQAAQALGIPIPATLVTSAQSRLCASGLGAQSVVLTKSVQESIFTPAGDAFYDLKAAEIPVTEVPEHFFPSLFQASIAKVIEIRAFYLAGDFYALAMLLCAAPERVVDFRTQTRQIRYCRYQLPNSLTRQLTRLMRMLQLNTGSIDLVRTAEGHYYFLEVNPTGQFGWVSEYGSYCLEKKIAEYLLHQHEAFEKSTVRARQL
ncbi:ATP-grasp domain-containing protein [Hymenobacter elongatus]|uniref:Grasp-with-spasm system ATP-grasp peptide maturase n=1 Tax=Hymenobacter elongatus TaxID=877208 RepID=A0A4Z0PFN8_9BACT|nr:hypothetical protein [Hymenobacter elongatus]TGE12628.1 hypothetical protein E5J99_20030 [Hymenobacter elongatus]